MKKIITVLCMLCAVLAAYLSAPLCSALESGDINAQSAVLVEASSGKVLFESAADIPRPPASVTKIMTLLLVFEALDSGKISWDDTVSVSETAASMGGSQVFLAPGEQMNITDMIKSVAVASANDAATALAEHVSGSVGGFVALMNKRAAELGMENTVFFNPTGLDDAECNMTSARDIAIMSRELLSHEKIFDFTKIWTDTIRNGEFGLTNTNRLIRFYSGANGLKTGSTSKAGFCISATAERDGMQLIAVIMGSPSRDIRNEAAKELLDYGFANFGRFSEEAGPAGEIKVTGGVSYGCPLIREPFNYVSDKTQTANIVSDVELPGYIEAPVRRGDAVGRIVYRFGEEEIGSAAILAAEDVERIGFFGLFARLLEKFFI